MDRFTRLTAVGNVTICEENGRITDLIFDSDVSEDTECTETLAQAFRQLDEYLLGERKSFDLELDPKGTEFQRSVWNGLLRIPYGKVIGYSELAEMIGRPNAHRAAGNANGKNPIPIFIPCHRVIRSDGTIGGYSSGIEIKKRLLALEGAMKYVRI